MAIPSDYKNRIFSGDIEANGLLMQADKVWCIVSEDIETNKMYTFHDYPELCGQVVVDPYDDKEYVIPERTGSLVEGARFWYLAGHNGSKLAVHNCAGYDKFILEKFWPKCVLPDEAWVDTLIQSKVQWFDRPVSKGSKGVHGLQPWGCRFGVNKPDIEDWTKMDAFMLHRCIQDVHIQTKTYLYLEKEKAAVKDKLGIDFSCAYSEDFKVRLHDTRQELAGANVDSNTGWKLVDDLDNLSSDLRDEIEPQLPMSVKPKGAKVGLAEISEILGLKRKLRDEYEKVVVKGEWVDKIKKPFYKPSMSYTTNKKSLQYSGEHIAFGKSPVYTKRKDLTDWIKETFPDTKQKDWDIQKVELIVTLLNHHTVNHFECEPTDTDYICGPHTKLEWLPTQMSQHDKVKSFLLSLGWTPDDWNYKKDPVNGGFMRDDNNKLIPTSPKLTESSYESLPEGLGLKIAHYNTYVHRRRFLANPDDDTKGILNLIRPDGRLTCGLNLSATSTLRYSQSGWVNAPGEGALFGEEVRSLIIPTEGWKLVGADMKSAQLSIAAYYANNKEYYDAVADGQEVIKVDGKEVYVGQSGHCVNARAFTLVSEREWEEAVRTQNPELLKSIALRRKKSKGGSFACLPVHNTEVLTRTGWKWYHELVEGEDVMTYNTETGFNEFKPIQKIHFFKDKEVICMKNNEWQMDSTPDHRWFGYRRTGRGTTKREVAEFITTEDIKSEFKILNSAPFVGAEQSIVTPDEAALLGWILSDGSVSWKPYTTATSSMGGQKRGVKVVITQTDMKYGSEIQNLLEKVGAYTGTKTYKKGSRNPCANYTVAAPYFRKLWKKAGFDQQGKYEIDLVKFVLSLDNAALESFLDAFWKADGHKTNRGKCKVISQNRGNILEGVSLAAHLLGYNTSFRSKGVYEPTGKECIDMLLRSKRYTGSTKLEKIRLGVMDTFCLTTENSTFVCRQGDVVSITGNCIFGASGKKVAQTLGIPESLGETKKNAFLRNIGLDRTIELLKMMVNKNARAGGGYIELPFGYYAWSNQPHKYFNYLDQGTEAACQKWATRYFEDQLKTRGLDSNAMRIMSYHDELLVDSHPDIADEVGKLLCEAYETASYECWEWHRKNSKWFTENDFPTFMFNLDGGYKVGDTYLETH